MKQFNVQREWYMYCDNIRTVSGNLLCDSSITISGDVSCNTLKYNTLDPPVSMNNYSDASFGNLDVSGDLDVSGQIKMVDGTQGLGKVLTSDANGLASWGFTYEEGTWVPALDNITTNSSTMYGIYTKIGRICHIHAKISVVVAALPGAQWQISGLPYAATNTSDTGQRAIIAIGGDSFNLGGAANKGAHFVTNGSTLLGLYFNPSNNTEIWYYNGGDGNSIELHLHGHYTV
tara:strand:+ start:9847 stop:10542 length:696 start_codon:yes stop_codon:yes gene_type:complete